MIASQESLLLELNKASKHLLRDLGFSFKEIGEIVNGQDEVILTILSIAFVSLLESERIEFNSVSQSSKEFIPMLINYKQSQEITWDIVGKCALGALGIDIIIDLRSQTAGKKMTKKVLLKAFKKIGAKVASYLTGWGLLWTGVWFVGCLGAAYVL